MTKQEKQLLFIDLCARLPYGVKISFLNGTTLWTLTGMFESEYNGTMLIMLPPNPPKHSSPKTTNSPMKDCKPYLRPMSSMTEEEREHLQTLHNIISDENYGDGFSPAAWEAILDFNNYCREHHLDNGGLITLGLAIEAPEGMYK